MSQFTRELAKQIILSQNFVDTMTDLVSIEIEKQLRHMAGGDTLYIAKTSSTEDKAQRNKIIRAQFTGNNLVELAARFGLTDRQIRRIVR